MEDYYFDKKMGRHRSRLDRDIENVKIDRDELINAQNRQVALMEEQNRLLAEQNRLHKMTPEELCEQRKIDSMEAARRKSKKERDEKLVASIMEFLSIQKGLKDEIFKIYNSSWHRDFVDFLEIDKVNGTHLSSVQEMCLIREKINGIKLRMRVRLSITLKRVLSIENRFLTNWERENCDLSGLSAFLKEENRSFSNNGLILEKMNKYLSFYLQKAR